MNSFNDGSVAFLEDSDFSKDGKLIVKTPKDTVMVMIMGDFCGFCKKATPMYQEFALKNKNKAFMTCILTDGEASERALGARIGEFIPGYSGVPMFVMFKGGNFVGEHQGGRTVEELEKFLASA